MTVITASRPAPSAGVSPEEIALMRHAAARLNPNPAASAPDPFAALAFPYAPGPAGDRAQWVKFHPSGQHWCM